MKEKVSMLALLIISLGFVSTASAQEGDVKYRQAVMKAIAGHATGIAQIAYGGVTHLDHLQVHVDGLTAAAGLVKTAFEAEAMTEDPPTTAKAEIWQKWAKFESAAADLEKAAAGVADAAAGGDPNDVAGALDPLWDSCKGCHKPFRKKN